jgi:hypothetical protein
MTEGGIVSPMTPREFARLTLLAMVQNRDPSDLAPPNVPVGIEMTVENMRDLAEEYQAVCSMLLALMHTQFDVDRMLALQTAFRGLDETGGGDR